MAMWLRKLEVADCAGIAEASVELQPGLNVLHGPNELGKSTLVGAVRAALLLPASSTAAQRLRSWNVDSAPEVALTFEQEAQRIWRVRKRFTSGGGGTYLEFSRDGSTFSQEGRGREVEQRLQDILRWGIEPPGGRGGKRGMPSSFITTALLGDQSAIEAILDTNLDEDPTDSGRDRLTEALQALAEDPRFKEVLASVQEKVDEAFTKTGRRNTGRLSPWKRLAEERATAVLREQDIRQAVEASETARNRVRELGTQLFEAEAEAEQTAATFKAARERETATQALREAEEQLAQAANQMRTLEQKRTAVEMQEKEVDALRQAHLSAEGSVKETEPRAQAAQQRVQQLRSVDAEQARQLRLQEEENKRLTLQQRVTDLAKRTEQAKARAAREQAIAAKNKEVEQQATTLAEQREQLAAAQAANEADKAQLAKLTQERDCANYRTALAKAEKCKQELAVLRKHANEAKTLAAQAQTKRAEAKALQAPAQAELKRLQQLDEDRRVARAKLAVGLTLDFMPERAGQAEVAVDGETRQRQYAAGERLAYQAERELRLTLEGVGTIAVRGGGTDLQREAQAAADRWQMEAEPIFARAGLDSIEGLQALEAKVELAANLGDEATRLENEAAQARLRSDGLDEAERAAAVAKAEAEQHHQAVAERLAPGTAIEEVLGEHDEARAAAIIEQEMQALQAQVGERDTDRIKLTTALEMGDAALATAKQEVAKEQQAFAASEPKEDWRKLLVDGEADRQQLEEQVSAVNAAIAAMWAEATAEAEEAEAQQAVLDKELQAKRQARDDLAQRLQEVEKQLEGARGEAKALANAAKGIDLSALQAARDNRLAELEALPSVEADSIGDLAELHRQAEHSKAAAASIRGELLTAKGALSQTGGQAIEEQAAQAREALAALDRREHELEVDYGAWKLLHETLTEAEQEDAAHLGSALVQPVSERMNALTGGRYEQVGIGPQLDATGIHLGGDERDFGDVSVGTREQIALLLRLSIAEALESFLILDDHLTQSDPVRMAWIRNLLGEAAENIQVIVMTCHPTAYITGNEHAVDLKQCIKRHEVGR